VQVSRVTDRRETFLAAMRAAGGTDVPQSSVRSRNGGALKIQRRNPADPTRKAIRSLSARLDERFQTVGGFPTESSRNGAQQVEVDGSICAVVRRPCVEDVPRATREALHRNEILRASDAQRLVEE
jgi:hypothetical protein